MAHEEIGFVNYAGLCFSSHPRVEDSKVKKSFLESIGGAMVWHIYVLPRVIRDFFKSPIIAVIALTALAMIAVQFAFYPVVSYLALKHFVVWAMSYITLSAIRFGSWFLIEFTILGFGIRSLGRVSNEKLVKEYKGKVDLEGLEHARQRAMEYRRQGRAKEWFYEDYHTPEKLAIARQWEQEKMAKEDPILVDQPS